MKKLNAYQLKLIGLFFMLLDHLYFAFPMIFPLILHPLSRFVAPLFAYFMVEGYYYTSNRKAYIKRLFAWALFMQLGNCAIGKLFSRKDIAVSNNIFLTLALGSLILVSLELIKKTKGKKRLPAFILLFTLMFFGVFTEGGIVIIPFITLTYLFRGKKEKLYPAYIAFSLLIFFTSYVKGDSIAHTVNMLMFNSDFLFVTVIPFISLYNGERGPNRPFHKYLFYIFYPAHLWLLALSRFLI